MCRASWAVCERDPLAGTIKYHNVVEVGAVECLLPIKVEPLEEGGYLANSEVLPGFLAQGRSITETLEIARDVARKLVECYVEHGDHLPDRLCVGTDRVQDWSDPSSLERGTGPAQ
jgi:predicted RNase H-like HicB family nuclease